MKKHTLIDVVYDECHHLYVVTIGTDVGEFTGTAQCAEEDYPHESEFFGFELAEIKANIEYAREKRKRWEAEVHALTSFWRNMAGTRNYNPDAFWVKQMRKSVDYAVAKRDFWTNEIQQLKMTYRAKIVAFEVMYKHKEKVVARND